MSESEYKLRCGVLGATGMVGKKFLELLSYHPWIEIVVVAASERSAGEKMLSKISVNDIGVISQNIQELTIKNVNEVEKISSLVDFVFCALDMPDDEIITLEEAYAKHEVVVVSNNSALRSYKDVPMIVPEINGVEHLKILDVQKKRLGTNYGCIVVKPNCAAQSFMTILDAFNRINGISINGNIFVSLMQAVSGSGKHLKDVPYIQGNVIPLPDEASKSIFEPMKIFGAIIQNKIIPNTNLNIRASSYRVPIEHGHIANVFINITNASQERVIEILKNYNPLKKYKLPSSPKQPINYIGDEYPTPLNDVNNQNGIYCWRNNF